MQRKTTRCPAPEHACQPLELRAESGKIPPDDLPAQQGARDARSSQGGTCKSGSRSEQSHDRFARGNDAYLRTQGVLELLPISRRTLFRWMENGQIRYIRAGVRTILFRRTDIERMMQRLTVGGAWQ